MDNTVKNLVEKRAYELFLKRGGKHGYALQDWFQAEKEVMAETESKKKDETRAAPVNKIAPKVQPIAGAASSSAPKPKATGERTAPRVIRKGK